MHPPQAPSRAARIMAAVGNNPSRDPPYHGTAHLYVVTLAAMELAAAERLTTAETDTALLAALFHDYDYAEDPDDTVNIAQAVDAVRFHLGFLDTAPIIAAIEGTCFPYVPGEPDRIQAVLRDADVLYSTLLFPDAQQFRSGLLIERGAPATEQDAIAFILGHGAQTSSGASAVTRHIAGVAGRSELPDLPFY
ncbi:hypothetical protein [Arthrobacter sp. CAN_A1]|uniref:hypothetical protein n=1 Tax=Arthrobacter sp. CAN_A1 TaxID=2787717 RepID=UPI0018C92985